jgi:hypothetical protein
VGPFIVITIGARGAIHQATKTQLHYNPFKLKTTTTKKALKSIHHNAVQFLMHIILTKRRTENKQRLPPDPP